MSAEFRDEEFHLKKKRRDSSAKVRSTKLVASDEQVASLLDEEVKAQPNGLTVITKHENCNRKGKPKSNKKKSPKSAHKRQHRRSGSYLESEVIANVSPGGTKKV